MLWKISKKFQFAADRLIPNSFVFCLVLTFIVLALAMVFTAFNVVDVIGFWYNGLWSMIGFAFQMTIMVVVCSSVAKAPQIDKILSRLAKMPKKPSTAYIVLICFSFAAGWINWSFAVILAPIFAMYLSKNIKKCHFPLMVVSGYACMVMVQPICPSASCVALLASSDHFMVDSIGVIPASLTAFSPIALITVGLLFVTTILIAIGLKPPVNEVIEFTGEISSSTGDEEVENKTLADKMNNSKLLMYAVAIMGVIYIFHSFITKGIIPSLSLNFVIFAFLILSIALYKTPNRFVNAMSESMSLATQVMIQFPFYGGIMGIMASSGLTLIVANGLTVLATEHTVYWISYLSASIVNLFVPSQGGQWIVQGPILVETARAFNADIPTVVTAFMLGDEATNLIQPLYVIPALALVNMKLKEAWGLMAFMWACWFIVTTIALIVLPMILL